MKKLWNAIVHWLLSSRIKELQSIEKALSDKEKALQPIYTSIRTFQGLNAEYYGWICRILISEEYKFMCFDLRENIIKNMIGQADEKELIRNAGRLDMINVIGNYLTEMKRQYEEKILRDTK